MKNELLTQQNENVTKHAVNVLPSVTPSVEDQPRLFELLTERVITNLKGRYIDLPQAEGNAAAERAILQLGGIQKLVKANIDVQSPQKPHPPIPGVFTTTAWDLLVSQQFMQLDASTIAQERGEDGLTHHERHLDKAVHEIAHGRAVRAHAKLYPKEQIDRQVQAAKQQGSDVTDESIRHKRARKELGGGIHPDKHPHAHQVYTQEKLELRTQLIAGNLTGLSEQEQREAAKSLGGIKKLANERAQQIVIEQIREAVKQLGQQDNQRILKQMHWEVLLEKSLPPSLDSSALDQHLASIIRQSGGLGQHSKLSQAERTWVIRVSDQELSQKLAGESLGRNGVPITYSMLQEDLAKEHIVAPDIASMIEINRRLEHPSLHAVMVMCPDYRREYNGTDVTYKFDGLSGGIGLVGEVGLPVILPIAKRVGEIHNARPQSGNIPTFHLVYADIEATEGNIQSTGVGTKEKFLELLDQSATAVAKKVEEYFGKGKYGIEHTIQKGENMYEHMLVIKNSQGKDMVTFRIGALTTLVDRKDGTSPSEQFARKTNHVREEGRALLEKGSSGFIADIDGALQERLPIVLKLRWDELEKIPGASTVIELAKLHNSLGKGEHHQTISPRNWSRGIEGLVHELNQLISQTNGSVTSREINRTILSWLKVNMPQALQVIRTKHIMQLAEYVTVCRSLAETYNTHAVQIVGDSLLMNQKAARGVALPQLLIKGRFQYSGSVSQEELAAGN